MTPLKSHLDLWSRIACTFILTTSASISTAHAHGDLNPTKFLTHDLPTLGKDFDRGLANHFFVLTPGSFKRKKDKCYPVFLNEYFKRVFYPSGLILENPCYEAMDQLRTLLFLFYKYEVPLDSSKIQEASTKFIVTDQSVKTDFSDVDILSIKTIFNQLLPDDPMDIRPRHSNGATADGFNNLDKRTIRRYIPSLMDVYTPQYFFNTYGHALEHKRNKFIIVEPKSKVQFVPKDARGPRTICMEPHERMFIQKGLMHKIYDHIELYSPACGRINFTDQSINQRLAYLGSLDGSLSTIDLKDASDMVSWSLVKQLVDDEWLAVLTACRTPSALLPDGTTVELKKFAPMGSALCFPIEAMIFYSIAKTITDDVWVYGDDIIVPTQYASLVMRRLEHYGLVVNDQKSLTKGFFRESCGADFYKGHNITPVRYRKDALISVVEFANLLTQKFSEETGLCVIEWFESINQTVILRLPYSNVNSAFIAFFTLRENTILFKRRYNADLQRIEYRSLLTTAMPYRVPELDYDYLFDWLTITNGYNSPSSDRQCDIIYDVPVEKAKWFGVDREIRTLLSKERVGYGWGDIIT